MLFSGQGFMVWFALAVLLLGASFMQVRALEQARIHIVDALSPVLLRVGSPLQSMATTLSDLSGLTTLKAENAQLRIENDRLREWFQTAQMLKAENTALRDLMRVQADAPMRFVSARVIADPSSVYVHSVLVNAGAGAQVRIDQPVMTGEGVMGRVSQVGQNVSRVLLLTDVNSRLPVVIENTGHRAIAGGINEKELSLDLLADDARIVEGARVVTSGDGGFFPAGLPVGHITSTEPGNVRVRPYADMHGTLFVQIMDTGTEALKSDILLEDSGTPAKK